MDFGYALVYILNSDTRGFISSIMLKASHFSAFSYIFIPYSGC